MRQAGFAKTAIPCACTAIAHDKRDIRPGYDCGNPEMITIRPAITADAPATAMLSRQVFQETYGNALTTPALTRHLSDALSDQAVASEIDNPDSLTLLAYRNDTLAGVSLLTRNRPPACVPIRPAVEISRFYVDRRERGTGLAYELLIHSRHAAWEHGAAVVWLCTWEQNNRAIAFYRKHGFLEVGIKTIRIPPVDFHDLVLANEIRV